MFCSNQKQLHLLRAVSTIFRGDYVGFPNASLLIASERILASHSNMLQNRMPEKRL